MVLMEFYLPECKHSKGSFQKVAVLPSFISNEMCNSNFAEGRARPFAGAAHFFSGRYSKSH